MKTLHGLKPIPGNRLLCAKKIISALNKKLVLFLFLFINTISTPISAQPGSFPSMTFHSPVLISGASNEVGATYLFANVCNGVDANVTIMGFFHGASLYNIDDTAGIGYYDAFQPYVGASPNDSSFIDWKINFKAAGTDRDTILPKVAITGIDVDGDGTYLKEFIVASTPGTFGLDPNTILYYTFDGVVSTAISTVQNFPLIDTSERRAMFQMNFTNVSSILYRNGAVSTYSSGQIRQTCIYFKSFFTEEVLLSAKLLSFSAEPKEETVNLNWSATNEENLKYYFLQKSTNGNSWQNISKVEVGLSPTRNIYSITDFQKNNITVYYRLQQVTTNGSFTYSKTLKVDYSGDNNLKINHNTLINNNIQFEISTSQKEEYGFIVYAMTGKTISQYNAKMEAGVNNFTIGLPKLSPGIYILSIKDKNGQRVYNSKLIKN